MTTSTEGVLTREKVGLIANPPHTLLHVFSEGDSPIWRGEEDYNHNISLPAINTKQTTNKCKTNNKQMQNK